MITYQTPTRYNATTGKESAWSSVRQPYLFTMYRRDGEYTSTAIQPGTGYLTLVGTNPTFLTRQIFVGEGFTIVNQLGNKVSGKVTAILGSNGPNPGASLVVTDIPANVTYGGPGYILWSAYENYSFQIELTGDLASGQTDIALGIAEGTPDSRGKVAIDVRDLLLRGMEKINFFDYGAGGSPNVKDQNGWIKFKAQYRNTYIFEGRPVTDTPNPEKLLKPTGDNTYWGIDAVKAIMNQYGQNFADYLPDMVAHPAKFLTAFQNPTYFVGYPFSVSFIYNQTLAAQTLDLWEDELIGQGPGVLQQTSTTLDSTMADGVNQAILSGLYDPSTAYVGAYLLITNGPIARFVAFGYVSTGYVITSTPVPVPGGILAISESKIIAINRDCRRDPIYVMWKNQLGGWDYWLFDRVRENEVSAAIGTIWETYIDYIDAYQFRQQISGASQVTKITMGDSVDKQSLEAIAGIEGSPQVYILRDPTMSQYPPNMNWLGVRMAPKGFKWNNRGNTFDVEISILLPETYQISN